MRKCQLWILQDALFRLYGEEKAEKILHSDIPVRDVIRSLAWEDSEFFRKWFLMAPKLCYPFG